MNAIATRSTETNHIQKLSWQKFPRGRYFLKNKDLFWFSFKAFLKVYLLERKFDHRQQLVEFFKNYYSAEFGLTCSSCRMALFHILQTLNLNSHDEIILTPITIPDMMNMILLSNLNPKFVDLDIKNHGVDIQSLKSKINAKTKVILVTHISGISQDMKKIKDICKENNLVLIEDVSQAHGASSHNGQRLGSWGDYTIISLTVGKSISSFVGGVILCRNQEAYFKISDSIRTETGNKTTPIGILLKKIIESFKVSLLTHPYVFSYFIFYAITFLSKMGLVEYDEIHKEKVNAKYIEKDLFLKDQSYRRHKVPLNLFFDINQWQGAFALEMSRKHQELLNERLDKMIYFVEQLNEKARACLSLDLDCLKNHNYYHIPFYLDNNEQVVGLKKFLLAHGVDTGGYSLSLCSSLKEFPEFLQSVVSAEKIYTNCFFIPVDETLSLESLRRVAMVLNRGIIEIS